MTTKTVTAKYKSGHIKIAPLYNGLFIIFLVLNIGYFI